MLPKYLSVDCNRSSEYEANRCLYWLIHPHCYAVWKGTHWCTIFCCYGYFSLIWETISFTKYSFFMLLYWMMDCQITHQKCLRWIRINISKFWSIFWGAMILCFYHMIGRLKFSNDQEFSLKYSWLWRMKMMQFYLVYLQLSKNPSRNKYRNNGVSKKQQLWY